MVTFHLQIILYVMVAGNNVLVPTSVGAMVTVSAAPSQSLGSSPAIVLSAGHALSAARAGQVPVSMATENTTNSVTSDQVREREREREGKREKKREGT